jgi:hypothetical protein
MKITRQRLKDIIMEEIALQEASPDLTQMTTAPGEGTGQTAYVGNAPADSVQSGEEIDQISEAELEEGLETVTLDNLQLVADVAAKMGANFTPIIAGAIASMSLKDAIDYLLKKKDADKETETALEEAEEDTLEELITQAIQEELGRL